MTKNSNRTKKFFAKLRQMCRQPTGTMDGPESYFANNDRIRIKPTDLATDPKAVMPSHLVIKGFVLAFVFTMLILGGLTWYIWRSNQHLKELETRHFRLLELSGEIIHIDEVLTMSTHMAVETGETEWEARYRKFEPQLDSAIKEVIELSPEQFMIEAISQTDIANIKLVAMENKAFDLVRRGDRQTASNILHGPEYKKQKEIYTKGITEIVETVFSHEQIRLRNEQRIALVTIIALAVTVPLTAFIWFAALRILKRYINERRRTELALRTSEQCFSAIADYSYFWEIWVSPAGRPIWTNPAVQRVTGYTIKELMAMSDYPEPLIHEPDRKRMVRAFNSAMKGGRGKEVEFRLQKKDGTIIWAEMSWQPIYDENGIPLGHRESIRDITARKKALLAEKETQERFSDFFKNAPIGFHIFRSDRIIIDINDAELEMIGCQRDEIVGKKTWSDLIIPEEKQQFEKHWHDITTKGYAKNLEYTLVHKDGHHINVILNASSRFDEEGCLLNTRGSVLDITARKRAEEETERIFNTTNYMICVADMDGYFRRINDSFEQTLGYSSEELLKKPFFEFIHPDDIEDTKAVIEEKLSRGAKVIGFENRYRCKDGTYKWLSWSSQPVVEEGIMYAIAYDITDRKLAELARQRLNKELQTKNEELESVLYAASHDLKSPLVNIQGFSHELSQSCNLIQSILTGKTKTPDTEKAVNIALNKNIPNALDFILTSTDKMDSLLSGLLDLSRLNITAINAKHIDMNALMLDVIATMEYQITEAGAKVDIENLPPCIGDPAQTNRIFSNLLTNALKFLDEARPGQIRISGKSRGDKSIYCVEDNGIGIAPEQQEKIFEMFYQLEPENKTGDGIGLTIVKRIIDKHNGKIQVESEPGKGSKFFVSLPNT